MRKYNFKLINSDKAKHFSEISLNGIYLTNEEVLQLLDASAKFYMDMTNPNGDD